LENKTHPSPTTNPSRLGHWQDHHRQNHYIIEKETSAPQILAPGISEKSCVIVGLFHDIGKVGMPGKPYYLPEIKD
jgi:hypothetical protein